MDDFLQASFTLLVAEFFLIDDVRLKRFLGAEGHSKSRTVRAETAIEVHFIRPMVSKSWTNVSIVSGGAWKRKGEPVTFSPQGGNLQPKGCDEYKVECFRSEQKHGITRSVIDVVVLSV